MSNIFEFDEFRLEPDEERLWQGSTPLTLRPRTYAVLKHLVERSGQLVRYDELLDAVWVDVVVTPGTLNTSIRELRKALGDDARRPRYIATEHRRGFRFVAEVRHANDDAAGEDSPGPPGYVPVVVEPRRLHGRGAELERLDGLLAAADTGTRQIVFITGGAGIGKTSLLRSFAQRHAAEPGEDDLRFAWGQCAHEHGRDEAYHPILDALDRVVRSETPGALLDTMRRYAPTWLVQLPGVMEPLEAAELSRELGSATPARMLREFCVATEVLTRERTVVLVLEDLHWSDRATVDLIRALAERAEPSRLLLLATYRHVEAAIVEHPVAPLRRRLLQRGAARDLELEPIPESAVDGYLCERFGWTQSPPGLAAALHDQTDGNPLFMVTLASYLVSRGALVRTGETWKLTENAKALATLAPESLGEIVEEQLESLAGPDRELLEAASVSGESFTAQALAAGLEVALEPVEESCGRLARYRQFIEEQDIAHWPDGSVGRRFCFQHDAFRYFIYSRISPAKRQQIHLRIAERMAVGYASDANGPFAEIADHFENAGDPLRTATYLARAADSDRRRFAHREAADYLRRAIALLLTAEKNRDRDRTELGLQFELARSVAVGAGWGSPELDENLERCLRLSRKLGDKRSEAFTLDRLMRRNVFCSDFGAARNNLEELRTIAPEVDSSSLQADVCLHAGLLALRAGELARAAEAFDEAARFDIDTAELSRGVLYNPTAVALSAGGYCAWLRGLPDDARRHARAGVSEAERSREGLATVAAHAICAEIGRFTGRADEVRSALERYRAALASRGIFYRSPAYLASENWLLLEDGRADEAAANLREGLESVKASGTTLWLSCLYAVLAEASIAQEEAAQGLRATAEGLDYCNNTGERAWEAELLRLRGELLLLDGDQRAAEESFAGALELARAQGARSLELRSATSLARHLHRRGEADRARDALEPVLAGFDQGQDTRDLLTANALLRAL